VKRADVLVARKARDADRIAAEARAPFRWLSGSPRTAWLPPCCRRSPTRRTEVVRASRVMSGWTKVGCCTM